MLEEEGNATRLSGTTRAGTSTSTSAGIRAGSRAGTGGARIRIPNFSGRARLHDHQ